MFIAPIEFRELAVCIERGIVQSATHHDLTLRYAPGVHDWMVIAEALRMAAERNG